MNVVKYTDEFCELKNKMCVMFCYMQKYELALILNIPGIYLKCTNLKKKNIDLFCKWNWWKILNIHATVMSYHRNRTFNVLKQKPATVVGKKCQCASKKTV